MDFKHVKFTTTQELKEYGYPVVVSCGGTGGVETKEMERLGRMKFGKDPTVETSFLPDSEREAEEQAERERLWKQWLLEQESIKNEPLETTYSCWDGTGHRRVIQLFHFDVHEDVRTIADATIEKDESEFSSWSDIFAVEKSSFNPI